MLTGKDRTRRSLIMSIAVVIAVSRMALCSVEGPVHASHHHVHVSIPFNEVEF